LNATKSSSSSSNDDSTLMLNEKQILNQTLAQKNEGGDTSKQMIKQLRPKKVRVLFVLCFQIYSVL